MSIPMPDTITKLHNFPLQLAHANLCHRYTHTVSGGKMDHERRNAIRVGLGLSAAAMGGVSIAASASDAATPPYLKTISDAANDGSLSIFRFLPSSSAQIQAFRNGTSEVDCTKYIQDALDLGVEVVFPNGVYLVSPDKKSPSIKNAQSPGLGCLNLKSGSSIVGAGTIRLAPGSYNSSGNGAIITNWGGDDLTFVRIVGVTVDGNAENVKGAFNGINLIGAHDVTISGVTAKNTPAIGGSGGIGIGVRSNYSSEFGSVNCAIHDSRIYNAGYIGVSVDRPNGFIMTGSFIDGTKDNGIDIFGNDSTGGENNPGDIRNVILSSNIIKNVKGSAIFLESGGDAIIDSVSIDGFGSNGIIMNRMNSGSLNNIISNVKIRNDGSGVGVKFKNTCGHTQTSNLRFESLEHSYHMEGAQYIHIASGVHKNIAKELIKVTDNNHVMFYNSLVERQVCHNSSQPQLLSQVSSGAISGCTTSGIHWLNGNREI